jgi:hypothetical protein
VKAVHHLKKALGHRKPNAYGLIHSTTVLHGVPQACKAALVGVALLLVFAPMPTLVQDAGAAQAADTDGDGVSDSSDNCPIVASSG